MKKHPSVKSVINKAIIMLKDLGEKRWTKGTFARDSLGNGVYPLSKDACSFCNEGILQRILNANIDNSYAPIFKVIAAINHEWEKTIGSSMVAYNDSPQTTFKKNLKAWVKVRDAI